MLNEDAKKKLATEILEEVLSDPQARGTLNKVLHDLLATDEGEPVPVYGATSTERYGSFLCEFMPQAAAERMIEECEHIFDEQEVSSEGGERLKITESRTVRENHERIIREMAKLAVFTLLTNARAKLTAALWLNFEESVTTARATLVSMIAELLRLSSIDATADVRDEVTRLTKLAAEEEKKHVTRLLKSHRRLVVEGRRGPKPKVTTYRVRALLAEHGRIPAERMAELLSCDVTAVKDWARSTEWGTWRAARAALLTQVKKGEFKF